jgi:restriction system protein
MADITTRRQGEIIQTLFRILEDEPEGLRAKTAIERVEERMELTDFEKATFPKNPDLVRFPKIVRFSTITSVKAGWLRKNPSPTATAALHLVAGVAYDAAKGLRSSTHEKVG